MGYYINITWAIYISYICIPFPKWAERPAQHVCHQDNAGLGAPCVMAWSCDAQSFQKSVIKEYTLDQN